MNVARWKDVWRRFSGRGTYPHELAGMLLFPLRRIVLSPERLVARLHLTRTSRVLEIGPGPGFFSIDVARAVPQGRLELMDIQAEMLQKARRRLRRAGVANAGYTQANAVKLPFRNGCASPNPMRRQFRHGRPLPIRPTNYEFVPASWPSADATDDARQTYLQALVFRELQGRLCIAGVRPHAARSDDVGRRLLETRTRAPRSATAPDVRRARPCQARGVFVPSDNRKRTGRALAASAPR
jgi:SAM-dependent methyltransferase